MIDGTSGDKLILNRTISRNALEKSLGRICC